MRVCDRCKKDIGESGYHCGKYDFCRQCFDEYQKYRDSLFEKAEKQMRKWIKEGGRH